MLKTLRDRAELAKAKSVAFIGAQLPTGKRVRTIEDGLPERIALEVLQEFESRRMISHVRVGSDAAKRQDLVDRQAGIAIEVNMRLYDVGPVGRLPGALPITISIAALDELRAGEIKSFSKDELMESALEPATEATGWRTASFGLRDRDTWLLHGGILRPDQPIAFFASEDLLGMPVPGDPVPLAICWDGRSFGVVGRRIEVEPAAVGVLPDVGPAPQGVLRRVREGDLIRLVLARNLVRTFEFMLPDEGAAGAR